MEEYLLSCSPGDKGQEKDLPPPNPTFVSPPRPSPTPSRKPPAAATVTAEVTLIVCFTFGDLIPAWSRSILFGVLWKFCVFPAVPQTFVGQGGLAHSFPKLLSAFFPPTGSAMTLHLRECKSFPPSYWVCLTSSSQKKLPASLWPVSGAGNGSPGTARNSFLYSWISYK